MTTRVDTASPAYRVQQVILKAEWEAFEEDREKHLEERNAQLEKAESVPSMHGHVKRYRQGCPCEECREAYNQYMRDYRLSRGLTKASLGGRRDRADWTAYEEERERYLEELRNLRATYETRN